MEFRDERTLVIISLILLPLVYSVYTVDFDDNDDGTPSRWARCPWIGTSLKNGRVKIRSRGRIARFTCHPGFSMVGKKFATCVRSKWNNPIPFCVARGCYKMRDPLNGKMTSSYDGAVAQFECVPGYALQGLAVLYCDGNFWNEPAPLCVAMEEQPSTTCDFEDPDLCGWNFDPIGDFNWTRFHWATPSAEFGTGPRYDHTYGEGKAGFYLYAEASAPRKQFETCRIFSPVFPSTYNPSCFVFWYHMYGTNIGSLKVYIKLHSELFGDIVPLWELDGDQGQQWIMANISIADLYEPFQLVIEAILGSGYLGDIAIDDVSLAHHNLCTDLGKDFELKQKMSTKYSCRGRCSMKEENESDCGCTEYCQYNNTCCSDYAKICTQFVKIDNMPKRFTETHMTYSSSHPNSLPLVTGIATISESAVHSKVEISPSEVEFFTTGYETLNTTAKSPISTTSLQNLETFMTESEHTAIAIPLHPTPYYGTVTPTKETATIFNPKPHTPPQTTSSKIYTTRPQTTSTKIYTNPPQTTSTKIYTNPPQTTPRTKQFVPIQTMPTTMNFNSPQTTFTYSTASKTKPVTKYSNTIQTTSTRTYFDLSETIPTSKYFNPPSTSKYNNRETAISISSTKTSTAVSTVALTTTKSTKLPLPSVKISSISTSTTFSPKITPSTTIASTSSTPKTSTVKFSSASFPSTLTILRSTNSSVPIYTKKFPAHMTRSPTTSTKRDLTPLIDWKNSTVVSITQSTVNLQSPPQTETAVQKKPSNSSKDGREPFQSISAKTSPNSTATTPDLVWDSPRKNQTNKIPIFTLATSATLKDDSVEVRSESKSTMVALITVPVIGLVVLVAVLWYYFFKRRIPIQSKLSDDSEIRFLSDNEHVEFPEMDSEM